ncbi:hypothetical protein ETAA8_10080 [Anatilimnocola aggregata]|uniref:Response regulatory domain-containing protein n=1 Tax=Anatilimnocola aggregata TaxID=2528021 RepID=A0A517Y6U5_9BACT|nr:response regulator transcription factor [Anatilimnocola aggregata]QDU25936.1 hypothetical protein ETAA8_10080 [Anatilimnocola aggregata]
MINSPAPSLLAKILWCGGLLLLSSPVWLLQVGAQPPPGKGGADPFGDGAGDPKPTKREAGEAADIPRAESEVILQLRESNPKTPEAILQAALAVQNFGRDDEAKRYLTKFLDAKFPEEDLAPLVGKLGSDYFLKLSTTVDLQPEGQQVSTLVLTAARKLAEDPARLAALVKILSNSDFEAASSAIVRLEQAGPALVGPVLQALADPSRAAEHSGLYQALVDLATTSEAPLIGVLAGAPEPMQVVAANALGLMNSRDAVRHLLAPAWADSVSPELRTAARRALTQIMGGVPPRKDSEEYLVRQLRQIAEGQHPFKPNADNKTIVWQWDAAKASPVSSSLPLEDAIRQLNARIATDLQRMEPQSAEYQRLRLLHHLEFSKAIGGVARPLAKNSPAFVLATEAGPEMVADVLALAMAEKRHAAAIAALEVLGEIGDAKLLSSESSAPNVLPQALTHADRRVRLAAALAIVKLQPQTSFPGASHLTEVLGEAVRTAGVDRVLVVDARAAYAQTIVGLLSDQGYFGEVATNSRDAFRLATTSPDYDLILISDALDLPVTEMVQLLRRDRRTALIPIGVMIGTDHVDDLPTIVADQTLRDPVGKIRSYNVDSVGVLLADDRRTLVVPRPHTSETTAFIAGQVRQRGGRELLSREERNAHGRAALAALQTLASDNNSLNRFDVLRQEGSVITALGNPSLAAAATEVLATLATPKAQTALVDTASQPARALADRQAAAAAFAAAVKKRGILLTKPQIIAQYERYNSSATLDANTQAVLGGLLDTLESRRAASVPLKP